MIRNDHIHRNNLFFPILIVLIFFIVTIIISFTQFIWLDEAYTLNTTSATIPQIWNRAIYFEGQPPLYFIFLRIWRDIYDSIFFSRLFSIIAVTTSVFLVYKLSQKYISTIHPFLISLLFASNSIVIWSALEIRVYGLAILIAVLTVWLFLDTYVSGKKPSLYKRLIFSGLALLSVYVQYYLAFLLIGNFIFLIINRKLEIARLYIVDMIIPVLGASFMIKDILCQMSIHTYLDRTSFSLPDLFTFQFNKVSSYLFPFLYYINSGVLKLFFFGVIFAIILFFSRSYVKSVISRKNYFFIISIILLTLFTFLLLIVDKRNIAQRHSISLLLPAIFTLVLFLNAIKSVKVRNTILVLLIAGNLTADVIHFGIKEQKGANYENLARYIKANDVEKLPVFCFRYDPALILKYGLPEHNVIPVPVYVDFDSDFNRRKWVLKSTKQLDSLFSVNNIENGFWLATTETDSLINKSIEKRYNIRYDYKMLNDYISKNFNVVMERQFPPKLTLRKVAVLPKKSGLNTDFR